jgi:hypothetical protein
MLSIIREKKLKKLHREFHLTSISFLQFSINIFCFYSFGEFLNQYLFCLQPWSISREPLTSAILNREKHAFFSCVNSCCNDLRLFAIPFTSSQSDSSFYETRASSSILAPRTKSKQSTYTLAVLDFG